MSKPFVPTPSISRPATPSALDYGKDEASSTLLRDMDERGDRERKDREERERKEAAPSGQEQGESGLRLAAHACWKNPCWKNPCWKSPCWKKPCWTRQLDEMHWRVTWERTLPLTISRLAATYERGLRICMS